MAEQNLPGEHDPLRAQLAAYFSQEVLEEADPRGRYLELPAELAEPVVLGLESAAELANKFIELYPKNLTNDAEQAKRYQAILYSFGVQLENLLIIGILSLPQDQTLKENMKMLKEKAIEWANNLLREQLTEQGAKLLGITSISELISPTDSQPEDLPPSEINPPENKANE